MNDILSLFRYIPIVEQALQIANAPKIPCVVYERKNVVCTLETKVFGTFVDFSPEMIPVSIKKTRPLYIRSHVRFFQQLAHQMVA